jgi:hypothetical protein
MIRTAVRHPATRAPQEFDRWPRGLSLADIGKLVLRVLNVLCLEATSLARYVCASKDMTELQREAPKVLSCTAKIEQQASECWG